MVMAGVQSKETMGDLYERKTGLGALCRTPYLQAEANSAFFQEGERDDTMMKVRSITLKPALPAAQIKCGRSKTLVNGGRGRGRVSAKRVVRAEFDASQQEAETNVPTIDSIDISYNEYPSVQNHRAADVFTSVEEEASMPVERLEADDTAAAAPIDSHAAQMTTTQEFEEARQQLEAVWAAESKEPSQKKQQPWDTMFNDISPKTRSVLLLNLGAFLFGSNQAVIKSAEASMSPSILSFIRFAIAASVFTPRIVRGLKDAELRNASMELGLWLFGGYTTQILGLGMTSASHGALTGTFTVLIVPMLVGLTGRKVPPVIWASAVVAMGGMALLTSGDGSLNYGDGLCVLSAFLFGIHKFRTETVTANFENTDDLMAVQLFVLSVLSLLGATPEIYGYLRDSGFDISHTLSLASSVPWTSCVYMGLATTALTLWIECRALKDVSAPLAALIYSSEPLWGALVAMMFLGERFDTRGYIGGALIVMSSLGAQLVGDGKDSPKEKTS